jgi:trypsin-like peptidase
VSFSSELFSSSNAVYSFFTPVLLSDFPAIYMRLTLCQSARCEDVVRLSSEKIRSRKSAALAAVLGLATLAGLELACAFSPLEARPAQGQASSADEAATAALCPVVYPDDQEPASRGYHYTFFGNAFFINEQGYLLTVAHVVETFRDGGQAYILVNRQNAPPGLVQVTVVAKDLQHDVAILRAKVNPFAGKYSVKYVSLSTDAAVRGQSVLALSLHPQKLQDAHSFDSPREDSSPGTVLSYESTQLEKSASAASVFLLSHPVVKGQSGSPVLATDSRAVVGLVEGLWLRSSPGAIAKSGAQSNGTPGAAIPIQYAITLLKQHNVSWHSATSASSTPASPDAAKPGSTLAKSSAEKPNQ